jgi:hypothetical protein
MTDKENTVCEAPVPLSRIAETMGRSRKTVYRFEKKGWLETVNIAGKKYVTREALRDFSRRAGAGEFAQVSNIQAVQQRKALA